ncbi:MAG UNVERIFIED_CONTAM: hypothetical protein LVR18_11280 [Planctomycetaceae bacterium]
MCSQAHSDLLDGFLRRVWGGAIRGARPELEDAFALLAVGGNARRRPAPWSDVDLLMIIDTRLADEISPLMAAAVRDCWDATLQLGSSVRTRENTVEFAIKDVQFATSLCETRVLLGNPLLAELTLQQVRTQVYARQGLDWILKVVSARQEEWLRRGNSVNQLEPDVKRSPGGLRDIQLLRWIACVRHGNPEPQSLQSAGDISATELNDLLRADEFLTSLRMDLHFMQNLRQDGAHTRTPAENLRRSGRFRFESFTTRGSLHAAVLRSYVAGRCDRRVEWPTFPADCHCSCDSATSSCPLGLHRAT